MAYDIEKYLPICQQMLNEGQGIEDVLRYLRQNNLPKISALIIISYIGEEYGLVGNEALELVHLSNTWADLREVHERVYKEFFEAFGDSVEIIHDIDIEKVKAKFQNRKA